MNNWYVMDWKLPSGNAIVLAGPFTRSVAITFLMAKGSWIEQKKVNKV